MKRQNESNCTCELDVMMPVTVEISFWYYNGKDELSDSEREHIVESISDGHIAGELCDENEIRGWWEMKRKE